jgi:hypothetical protein
MNAALIIFIQPVFIDCPFMGIRPIRELAKENHGFKSI